VAEAVELVVFIARTPEGRRVREVVRVSSYDAVRESYVLEPVEPAPMEDEHA
jgi:Flp pilus assembly CpaF family ATPase